MTYDKAPELWNNHTELVLNQKFAEISKMWKAGDKYVRINVNDEYW